MDIFYFNYGVHVKSDPVPEVAKKKVKLSFRDVNKLANISSYKDLLEQCKTKFPELKLDAVNIMYINDSGELFSVASQNDYEDVASDFGNNTPKFIIVEKAPP